MHLVSLCIDDGLEDGIGDEFGLCGGEFFEWRVECEGGEGCVEAIAIDDS